MPLDTDTLLKITFARAAAIETTGVPDEDFGLETAAVPPCSALTWALDFTADV